MKVISEDPPRVMLTYITHVDLAGTLTELDIICFKFNGQNDRPFCYLVRYVRAVATNK